MCVVLRGSQNVPDLLQGLGHVEAHVGHLVAGHLQHHRQHVLSGDVRAAHVEQSLTRAHTQNIGWVLVVPIIS